MGDNEMRRGRQTAGGVPLHRAPYIAEILLLMICSKYLYLIAGEFPGKRCKSLSGTQALCPPGLGFQSPLTSEATQAEFPSYGMPGSMRCHSISLQRIINFIII